MKYRAAHERGDKLSRAPVAGPSQLRWYWNAACGLGKLIAGRVMIAGFDT